MKSKKEIVRKSELLAQIRADLKAWEKAEPDLTTTTSTSRT